MVFSYDEVIVRVKCYESSRLKTNTGHRYILSEDEENHRRFEILHVNQLPLSLCGLMQHVLGR